MDSIERSLHNLWVILRHEFGLYFQSPIVYFIGAVWFGISSIAFDYFFNYFNTGGSEPSMSNTLGFQITFLAVLMAPALTMRLVSDEISQGTYELLFTAPVRDWEVIVGKWLAVWGVFTVFLLLSVIYPLILLWRGNPDPGLIISGYIAVWLEAGAMLTMGVFASTLTHYQILAYFIGLILLFVGSYLWLPSAVGTTTLTSTLADLSFHNHHDAMLNQGLIQWLDVTYFLGVMAIFLFLATQIFGSRRWRA